MKDGTTRESMEGFVVPYTAARLAYEVLKRIQMAQGGENEKTQTVEE